jgi:hypothetical protein
MLEERQNYLSIYNVQGSAHRKYIPIYFQQYATLHGLSISGNCLNVSGGISTHHQEHTQLYLQHLILVKPLLLPAAIVEELELNSSSFTIAAGSKRLVKCQMLWIQLYVLLMMGGDTTRNM